MPANSAGSLDSVARWNSAAAGATFDEIRTEAEHQLSCALRQLLSVVDAHPELRASGEFQMIAQTIENVEDSLTNAWRRYNSSVRDYNRSIRVFPGNLLAILLGLRPKPLLGVPPEDEPASMAAAPRATT